MRQKFRIAPAVLFLIVLGLGLIGMILLRWYVAAESDIQGLLPEGHPARMLLWAATVLVLILLLWEAVCSPGMGKYSRMFPPSLPALLGCCAAGAVIFFTSLGNLVEKPANLNLAMNILGVLTLPAMILVGWNRYRGTRPSFLLNLFVTVYFALAVFCRYRSRSFDPRFETYAFHILAQICLMIAACEQAAFSLPLGSRRRLTAASLGAMFFCCVALGSWQEPLYWASCGLWAVTGMCDPSAPGLKKTREEPNHEASESA